MKKSLLNKNTFIMKEDRKGFVDNCTITFIFRVFEEGIKSRLVNNSVNK